MLITTIPFHNPCSVLQYTYLGTITKSLMQKISLDDLCLLALKLIHVLKINFPVIRSDGEARSWTREVDDG